MAEVLVHPEIMSTGQTSLCDPWAVAVMLLACDKVSSRTVMLLACDQVSASTGAMLEAFHAPAAPISTIVQKML